MADGILKQIEYGEDLIPGCIVRPIGENIAPFSDCVFIGFDQEKPNYCKLARPYVYVNSADTMCPGILTGVENFSVDFHRFKTRFVLVLTERGNQHQYKV